MGTPEASKQNEKKITRSFRKLLNPVIHGAGAGLHLDVHSFNPFREQYSRLRFEGTMEELEPIANDFREGNKKELEDALIVETAAYFFVELIELDPPIIERAAQQIEHISHVLTGNKYEYGLESGPRYQNLLKEIEKVVQEGEGIITLADRRSKLMFSRDPEGHLYLSVDPDSHQDVQERFVNLIYMAGFDEGKLPIEESCQWVEALKDWDSYYKQIIWHSSG